MYWKQKDSKRHNKYKVSVNLTESSLFYNDNEDKTDKSYKIRPVLNRVYAENMSNCQFQGVNGHMCKFKGRSSMKQYIKSKPIKCDFKYWYRSDGETVTSIS